MLNEPSLIQDRLSVIVTRWTLLQQAHGSSPETARKAQERLLNRYGGAIRRYLLGCVRNTDQADELYQEFAIKFIEGGLHGANPEKGRFRHYLKGILFHLLADQHQKRKRQPIGWHSELPEPAESGTSTPEAEAAFQEQWRAELLSNAWSDANASKALSSRNAANTTFNTAIMSGFMPSGFKPTSGAQYGFSGGAINFPRFLETWGNGSSWFKRWNYVGSFIILYNSHQANGPWSVVSSIVYYPPIRNWAFDITFTDPMRLPPGTPQFQHVEPTGFRQIL